jgi:PEP-CTERM motif
MRTPIIVGFIGVSLTTLAVQSSHADIVSANWDIMNDTDQDAKDFHVVVVQPMIHPPTAWVDGAFTKHTATEPGPPETTVTWEDGPVPKGSSTHVGLEFDSPAGEALAHDAWWTDKDGKQIGDKLFLPDFKIQPLFGEIEFSVIDDDTDTSLVFHNLQFQTRSSHTPLDQLIPYTLPGFGASVPDFTLSPGQSMTFDIEAGADDFVLAQMITYDPLNPADSTVGTVFQDGFRVPEPATWAMTLLGFAGLGYAGLRRAQVHRRAAGY